MDHGKDKMVLIMNARKMYCGRRSLEQEEERHSPLLILKGAGCCSDLNVGESTPKHGAFKKLFQRKASPTEGFKGKGHFVQSHFIKSKNIKVGKDEGEDYLLFDSGASGVPTASSAWGQGGKPKERRRSGLWRGLRGE